MRRILLVLTVGAMMAAIVALAATPAMAKGNGGNNNDGVNRLNDAPELILVGDDDSDIGDVVGNDDIEDVFGDDDIGDVVGNDDIEDVFGDDISLSELVLLEALD